MRKFLPEEGDIEAESGRRTAHLEPARQAAAPCLLTAAEQVRIDLLELDPLGTDVASRWRTRVERRGEACLGAKRGWNLDAQLSQIGVRRRSTIDEGVQHTHGRTTRVRLEPHVVGEAVRPAAAQRHRGPQRPALLDDDLLRPRGREDSSAHVEFAADRLALHLPAVDGQQAKVPAAAPAGEEANGAGIDLDIRAALLDRDLHTRRRRRPFPQREFEPLPRCQRRLKVQQQPTHAAVRPARQDTLLRRHGAGGRTKMHALPGPEPTAGQRHAAGDRMTGARQTGVLADDQARR